MVAQLVSTKSPSIPQMCAKGYKFVHVMVSELNFPRLVHCSDTACSLVLIHTHLGKTWTFGVDKLCRGLLHVFEVRCGFSWQENK